MKIKNLGSAIQLPLDNGQMIYLPTNNIVTVPDNTFRLASDKARLLAQNVTLTTDAGGAWSFPIDPAHAAEAVPVMAITDFTGGSTISSDWGGGVITLGIVDGDDIDTALTSVLAAVREYAELNRGRCPMVQIPAGNYTMSSTSATITLEPWMRISTLGNVRVVAVGHTVPVFWVRNDVTPQFSQGNSSENNAATVLDCRNGMMLIEGNKSAGGAGLRLGNGDGVWGALYGGAWTYFTGLGDYYGLHITGFTAGVQFTNHSSGMYRFTNLRLTDNVVNVQNSTAKINSNSNGPISFINCFLNSTSGSQVEINGGTAISTIESCINIDFTNCYIVGSTGDNLLLNTASRCRIHFLGGCIEGGDYLVRSTVLSPKSDIMYTATMNAPSKMSTSQANPFLRTLFKSVGGGTDYVVKIASLAMDMVAANSWSIPEINTAAAMFMADDGVVMLCSNLYANYSSGTVAQNNSMRNQPIASSKCFLNRNSGFEEAALTTGWTTGGTGTWSRDTAEFFSGVASAKLVCTAQHGYIESEQVPVMAGQAYHADCALKIVAAGSPNIYIIPQIEFLAGDGATSLGTTVLTPDASNSNYYNRRTDGWIRHQTGTGLVVAPAGARFARCRFSVSLGVEAGSGFNGTVAFDRAGLFSIQ